MLLTVSSRVFPWDLGNEAEVGSLLCSSHEEKEIPVGDVVDISFLVSCMRFYLLLNQRDQEYAS